MVRQGLRSGGVAPPVADSADDSMSRATVGQASTSTRAEAEGEEEGTVIGRRNAPRTTRNSAVNYANNQRKVRQTAMASSADSKTIISTVQAAKKRRPARKTAVKYKSNTHISVLPPHILISIFEHLLVHERVLVERVCRRWQTLAKGYGWQRQRVLMLHDMWPSTSTDEIEADEEDVTDRKRSTAAIKPRVTAVAQRIGGTLRTVDLSTIGHDRFNYDIIKPLTTFCTNIRRLNLTGVQMTNKTIGVLGMSCVHLRDVVLRRCFSGVNAERGLSVLFENCAHLVNVDLSHNEFLDGRLSFPLLPLTVRRLLVQSCSRLNIRSVAAVGARLGQVLEYLDVGDMGLDFDTEAMNLAMMQFKRLKGLVLFPREHGVHYVQHLWMGPALTGLTHISTLTALHLPGNYALTDTSIDLITSRLFDTLQTLNIGVLTNDYFSLTHANRVTSASLMTIGKCTKLRRLNLGGHHVTPIVVQCISKCRMINDLWLNGTQIRDADVATLTKAFDNLYRLDVGNCKELTHASLDTFDEFARNHKQTLEVYAERMLGYVDYNHAFYHVTPHKRLELHYHDLESTFHPNCVGDVDHVIDGTCEFDEEFVDGRRRDGERGWM